MTPVAYLRLSRVGWIALHVLMVGWVVANAFMAKPYAREPVCYAGQWALFSLNPVLFGISGSLGGRGRLPCRGVVYPALVLIVWHVAPALWAALEWGYTSVPYFALWFYRGEPWFVTAYVGGCVLAYALCWIVATRAAKRQRNMRDG